MFHWRKVVIRSSMSFNVDSHSLKNLHLIIFTINLKNFCIVLVLLYLTINFFFDLFNFLKESDNRKWFWSVMIVLIIIDFESSFKIVISISSSNMFLKFLCFSFQKVICTSKQNDRIRIYVSLKFRKILLWIFFFIFLGLVVLLIIIITFTFFYLNQLDRFWFCVIKDLLCIFISSWEAVQNKSSVLAVVFIESQLNQFRKIGTWESFMLMLFLPLLTFLNDLNIRIHLL